eukprot:jgi/Astpho2/3280/Aster-08044
MSSHRNAPGLVMVAAGLGTLFTGAAAGAIRARYQQQQRQRLQLQQENQQLANEVHSTPYNHLLMGLHGILRQNPGVQLSGNAALPCRLIGLYLRGPNLATLHHRGSS